MFDFTPTQHVTAPTSTTTSAGVVMPSMPQHRSGSGAAARPEPVMFIMIRRQQRSKRPRKHPCSACPSVPAFKSVDEYYTHMRTVHNAEKCSICGCMYSYINVHKQDMHGSSRNSKKFQELQVSIHFQTAYQACP